jgi:hypothetical protein
MVSPWNQGGNVYGAGLTFSSDFPGVNAASADPELNSASEAFVAKLDPDLKSVLAATYLGGADEGPKAYAQALLAGC